MLKVKRIIFFPFGGRLFYAWPTQKYVSFIPGLIKDQIQKKVFSTSDACFFIILIQGIQKYELEPNPSRFWGQSKNAHKDKSAA